DNVCVRKRNRSHQLGEVSFWRWKGPAISNTRRRDCSSHGKHELRKRRFTQHRKSRWKVARLEDVGSQIRRFAPGEAPRQIERHGLLNLVDKIRQRLGAPVVQESSPTQRRSTGAFHPAAVTSPALDFVQLLSSRCLLNRVRTLRDGS